MLRRAGGFCENVSLHSLASGRFVETHTRPSIRWPLGTGSFIDRRLGREFYIYETFLSVLALALVRGEGDGSERGHACGGGRTVVDIGTNAGYYVSLLGTAGCRVIGFEPQVTELTRACRAAAANGASGGRARRSSAQIYLVAA